MSNLWNTLILLNFNDTSLNFSILGDNLFDAMNQNLFRNVGKGMENISEANIFIEIIKYPQQCRLYQLNTFRVKRNSVMCCVPEPGTTRVNGVMTSSITIDKLQKEEVWIKVYGYRFISYFLYFFFV